jgi:hypothetical protein
MARHVVQIKTPTGIGSGAFVRRDLVLTAAHVIQPKGSGAPYAARRLAVLLRDGTRIGVSARLCHRKWETWWACDIAILRTTTTQPSLVIPTEIEPIASHRAVTVTGYREAPASGSVTRIGGIDGRDTFESDDLAFHEGVSGAPILDVNDVAIGIGTRSPSTPTPHAFIGVPFLDESHESNLSWLIKNCP